MVKRLILCAAAALAACGGVPAQAPPDGNVRLFQPLQTINSVRLIESDTRTGMPRLPVVGQFVTFVAPAAIAARGNDVLVADTGRRAIYRLDPMALTMTALPGESAPANTRLAIGADLSAYVLDPHGGQVRQYARGGQRLAEFANSLRPTRVTAIDYDERSGSLVGADLLNQELLGFHPLGGVATVVRPVAADAVRFEGVAGLASGREGFFVSDMGCRCVVELSRDGQRVRTYGADRLKQPGAVAADAAGRVVVLDRFDHTLHVYRAGKWLGAASARSLGLLAISDVALDAGRLYVADGPGARVAVFRLVMPKE